ncbi:winged helix-turn-helix domain-containing protein [Thalassotalea psychrophila]|uniref:Winged helix-turn-helix domain-containing protein n=1 Tax=Thalassotalea psychrophila TaxID=3065647 RepID=A0ABY9TZ01_9GAMM|nr:winged helix-turn-helix domain-containing protein [Colwelliaceae bacterium SQ149]
MIEVPFRKYQIGRWQLDCARMTISLGDKTEQLVPKVFELLKLFIVSLDQIVDKELAIEKVWNGNVGVGKTGFPNAVWHLRKAFFDLGAENDEVIVTIQKVGYQLIVNAQGIEEQKTVTIKPQKSKKAVSIIAVATATLLVLATILLPQLERTNQPSESKVLGAHVTNNEGVETQASISLDGKFMVFQWRKEARIGQVYIKDLQNKQAPLRKLTQSDSYETSPVWSPDGQQVAYFRFTEDDVCEVRIYNLITNKDRFIDDGCRTKLSSHPLDWSRNGKTLAYNKISDDGIVIFLHDLNTQQSKPLTVSSNNSEDLSVAFIENDKRIAIIREYGDSSDLLIVNNYLAEQPEFESLFVFDTIILTLAWDEHNQQLLINKPANGLYNIVALDLNNKSEQLIDNTPSPGSITINAATNELFVTRFLASEYITDISLLSGQIIRRVTSSSRNLYGKYVAKSDSILFFSNRSDGWELWLKGNIGSKQFTDNIGKMHIPTVSPSGEQIALIVTAKGEKRGRLHLADINSGEFRLVENLNYNMQNLSWSLDENRLFFSASKDGKMGIFVYDINTKQVSQISNSGEIFAIAGSDGNLYMSRNNQQGLWRFDPQNSTFEKIIDHLNLNDYGNFFWMAGKLYYLRRNDNADELMLYHDNAADEVVLSYPAKTIRAHQGVAASAPSRVLISMHANSDGDIYSLPLVRS